MIYGTRPQPECHKSRRALLTYIKWFKVYAQAAAMLRQAISCEWLTQWELKHVQYDADIVRWAGITKYVIFTGSAVPLIPPTHIL